MNPYSSIINIIETKGKIAPFHENLKQNINNLSHKIQIYEAELSYLYDLGILNNNISSTYLPILRSANEALLSITKYDHFEIYSYQKPPKIMETVMTGIPILLGCKKPSWEQYRIVAQRRSLWNDLQSLEVSPEALELIKPIIEEFEGNEMQLKICSAALYKWYSWMKLLYKYSQISIQMPSAEKIKLETDGKTQRIENLRKSLNSEIKIMKIMERIS